MLVEKWAGKDADSMQIFPKEILTVAKKKYIIE